MIFHSADCGSVGCEFQAVYIGHADLAAVRQGCSLGANKLAVAGDTLRDHLQAVRSISFAVKQSGRAHYLPLALIDPLAPEHWRDRAEPRRSCPPAKSSGE